MIQDSSRENSIDIPQKEPFYQETKKSKLIQPKNKREHIYVFIWNMLEQETPTILGKIVNAFIITIIVTQVTILILSTEPLIVNYAGGNKLKVLKFYIKMPYSSLNVYVL